MVSRLQIKAGLGRPERRIDISEPLSRLMLARVLVTGASGAIGRPLVATLRKQGIKVVPTDINVTGKPWGTEYMDIRDFSQVMQVVNFHEPDYIINLAAIKLAVPSEVNSWLTVDTNVNGLHNVLSMGRPTLQVSTCKASHSYCLYGQTKAVGERLTLNSGNSVVRLYNVPEATPSVLSIWDELPEYKPLPVTPCSRYVISVKEAIASILWATVLPKGRYAVDPGSPISMTDYASRVFPGREQVHIPRRRGDSPEEPLHGKFERLEDSGVKYINRIENPNDA